MECKKMCIIAQCYDYGVAKVLSFETDKCPYQFILDYFSDVGDFFGGPDSDFNTYSKRHMKKNKLETPTIQTIEWIFKNSKVDGNLESRFQLFKIDL